MYDRFRKPWCSCCAGVMNNCINAIDRQNRFLFFVLRFS
jgi:hypothetical protein